ncbi:MAG: hypothetical protein QGI13_04280 [Rhodospirillales bacterium]|nr:hypothetical protein [Rhodospirillales bacterium]
MNAFRCFLYPVAALALAACAVSNGVYTEFGATCIADSAERVAKVNWLEAETVDLRIRQGSYTPTIIRLRQDSPYVLRISNGDDSNRIFRANEFFGAVALAKVTMGEFESDESCISAIAVPAMETAEVRFVAVRDGRYEFEDNPLPLCQGHCRLRQRRHLDQRYPRHQVTAASGPS